MKIIEILVCDQENPNGDTFPPPHHIPDQDLMAHIANAFTDDRAVKLLWDLHIADEVPAPETSREDTGTTQQTGGTRLAPLAANSGAIRGVRFTPPF
jgi:hypothetical protein